MGPSGLHLLRSAALAAEAGFPPSVLGAASSVCLWTPGSPLCRYSLKMALASFPFLSAACFHDTVLLSTWVLVSGGSRAERRDAPTIPSAFTACTCIWLGSLV